MKTFSPRFVPILLLSLTSIFCGLEKVAGQAFLNGSFETTSATVDMINLSNATFNAAMSNTIAFGTTGNMDIITSCTWGCPTYGSWYVSLTGAGTDAISMQLSQNLSSGNSYTITYYDRKNASYQCTPVQIGVSTSSTSFGTLVYTAPTATNGTWTQRTVTFTAPNNGQYITVQQQGGNTGYWVHVDDFVFVNVTPNVDIIRYCLNDLTHFEPDTNAYDSVFWNFGDPSSGTNNTSTTFNPDHEFSDTGTFEVKWIVYADSNIDTFFYPVFIYPRQSVDLGPDMDVCVGTEVYLDVDQDYATYLWSNSSTDSAITVTSGSPVSVTVFGVCDTVSDAININWLQPFVVDLGNDTNMCVYDKDTILSGLPSNLQFSWNTGGSQPNQSVNDTGTYSLTVTDGTCTYSDEIHYGFYPDVKVSLGNDSSFCYTPSAILDPHEQNTSSYHWSTGATSSTITLSTSGDYRVTVSGIGGYCVDSSKVHWDFWWEPIVDLGNDTSFCHNDVLTVTPWVQSAFPVEYRWNDNSNQSFKNINLVGLYWVDVKNENCRMRDTILVDQYPILDITLGEDIKACEGAMTNLVPQSSQNILTFQWNDGSNNSSLQVSDAGTYAVTVTNELCHASDQINVFYYNYPPLDLGPDTAICPKDSLHFDISLPAEISGYRWFDGSLTPKRDLGFRGETWIWAQATNVVCTSIDSILVSWRVVAPIDLGRDTAICPEKPINLDVSNDQIYTEINWSSGETDRSISVQDTGLYSVSAFDGFCFANDEIYITHKAQPTEADIAIDVPAEICFGESFNVDLSNPIFKYFKWQDGSTNSYFTIDSAGTYWVEATHACGTIADTAVLVPCECPIWFPNAFRPNHNGTNDFFFAVTDCSFNSFDLKIFDRWGELLFSATDPTAVWDGKYKSEDVQAGSYGWVLKYTARDNHSDVKQELNGQVLLLR